MPVNAVEYEFQGVGEELAAGPVTFRLENTGEEPHEFALSKILTDTPLDELLQLPQNQVTEQIEDVGRVFAAPGDSDVFEAEWEFTVA